MIIYYGNGIRIEYTQIRDPGYMYSDMNRVSALGVTPESIERVETT